MSNLVALLVGAGVVSIFSFERFNRTTDETVQKFQRLAELLSPDKLRSRRVVLRAFLFYWVTFLLIYFSLCAYAELIPALGGPNLAVGASQLPIPAGSEVAGPTTGFTSAASSSGTGQQALSLAPGGGQAFDIRIDATISMAVALMIVGLAPAFPLLNRFETFMRASAHQLAGIPTRVLGIRDDLRAQVLALPNLEPDGQAPAETLLVPSSDWLRMHHYRLKTKGLLDAPEDFHNDIGLIFAISTWVLKGKLKLANPHERQRFFQLEEALARRKNVLVNALDEKTGFFVSLREGVEQEGKKDEQLGEGGTFEEGRSTSWERLSVEVDELAADLCILLALYAEHEIIVSEPAKVDGGEQPAPQLGEGRMLVVQQRELARERLEGFLKEHLGDQTGPARSRSFGMITGLWALSIVMVIALVWSLFPGRYESHLQRGAEVGPYWRILTYTFTTFLSFCIPIMVALAIRDAGIQLRHWRNMREALGSWTMLVPQAALVLVLSWALGIVFILAAALRQERFSNASAEEVWATLWFSLHYNGPTPLRGAVLALIIILLLDTWRVSREEISWKPTHFTSFSWAACTAVFMAFVGGLTRYMSSWAGAVQAAVPRERLDDIDRGLIAYAAIFSAMIGFCVIFAVSEVLLSQRRIPGSVNLKAPEV